MQMKFDFVRTHGNSSCITTTNKTGNAIVEFVGEDRLSDRSHTRLTNEIEQFCDKD